MIFDTHVHLNDLLFKDNYHELIQEAIRQNIKIMAVIGFDLESSKKAVELAKEYSFVYAVIGIHPSEQFKDYDKDLKELEKLICDKVVALGEMGLDYHYSPLDKQKQSDLFIKQLKLAKKYNLPIIIHSRDACNDTYNILKEYKDCYQKGIMHCYSYSLEMAKEFKKLNFLFGVGGVVTYKNGKVCKEVVEGLDLTDIVLETDAPYLPPTPFRGKVNLPEYIVYVAKEISELKKMEVNEVEYITTKNACEFFGVTYED